MLKKYAKEMATVILLIAVGWFSLNMLIHFKPEPLLELESVAHARYLDCIDDTLKKLKLSPDLQEPATLSQSAKYCSGVRYDELGFQIYRIKQQVYIEQNFVGRVMLWMVIVITLSGVLLAAMQLNGAYKLASRGSALTGQEGSIDIESGKISIKSSVTGLLILVVSFAFFYVFVDKIYTIRPVDLDGQQHQEVKEDGKDIIMNDPDGLPDKNQNSPTSVHLKGNVDENSPQRKK